MQDDLLHANLTVRETLHYAAFLRIPEEVPTEEKLRTVESVIQSLGLSRCQNTIIGENTCRLYLRACMQWNFANSDRMNPGIALIGFALWISFHKDIVRRCTMVVML